MKLKIYGNEEFTDSRALVLISETGVETLVIGDDYHDKICERIDGFLDGLIFAEVVYELDDSPEWINHKNPLFEQIGFIQEWDDEGDDEE